MQAKHDNRQKGVVLVEAGHPIGGVGLLKQKVKVL
jgi:hypothetical protein